MMAEAPKSTKKGDAAPAKKKSSGAARPTSKEAKAKVEDAVVIGETPPKESTKPRGKPNATPASARGASATTSKADAQAKLAGEPAEKAAAKPSAPAKNVTPPKPTPPADADKPKPPEASRAPKESERAAPGFEKPLEKPPEKRRRGAGAFLGFLLGGVAAAVIGFTAARTIVPDGWPFPGVEPEEDPLVGIVEAQQAQIAALEERLTALNATLTEVQSDTSALDALREDLAARLDGLETGAGEITEQVGSMETRLSSVEKLAPEGTEAAKLAAEAYAVELEALREMFAGELAEIDAAQAEATALEEQLAGSARAATGRAALAQVVAALDTGEPFETALGELAETTGMEIPDALAAVAADGTPALSELQQSFAEAARAAIEADLRTGVEDGSVNRMQAFLRTQLGTRSLEPREGDDADAVLSRAEAALKTGDLAGVLAELDALPEAAAPALADWRALAETRATALAAGQALADELNAK